MKKRLVVGLGNPGRKYRHTRHNIGFMVIDALEAAWGISLRDRPKEIAYDYEVSENIKIFLAKPLAYMNNSGPPTRRLADRLGIVCEEMIVIHDDIDLAFGRLKIKEKGGSGGHKGVRSLVNAFGEDGFTRLRIGIGRAIPGVEVTEHVLRPFEPDEKTALPGIIDRAAQAVYTILHEGPLAGMNKFNVKSEANET